MKLVETIEVMMTIISRIVRKIMKEVIPIKKDKVIFKILSCNNTHTHTKLHVHVLQNTHKGMNRQGCFTKNYITKREFMVEFIQMT